MCDNTMSTVRYRDFIIANRSIIVSARSRGASAKSSSVSISLCKRLADVITETNKTIINYLICLVDYGRVRERGRVFLISKQRVSAVGLSFFASPSLH